MIITGKTLPRRTVLRALGATLPLPWLDAMVPALAAVEKSAAAPARRLAAFYVPNGMALPFWYPKAEGALPELPPVLTALTPFKEHVLVVGGLDGEAAKNGSHAAASGTFLSCVPTQVRPGGVVIGATTMDQIVAREFAKETQLASLELGMEAAYLSGDCEVDCSLTNLISWSSPTTPLVIDNDPRSVFERLFGLSGSTDADARAAYNRRRRSVLDAMTRQVDRLVKDLGPEDRRKVQEYVDAIRDVERRIQNAEAQSGRELPVVEQPMGAPQDYAEHFKLLVDLQALAYQTDLTRVSTFMIGRELSNRAYPEVGVPDSHHPVSHHQNDMANIERLAKINAYHVLLFSRLVEKLAAMPEGDGTVLDHSVLLYGAGISDSNIHTHVELPIAIVGGKACGIKGGRHARFPRQPLETLHLTLLNALGLKVDTFAGTSHQLTLG